MWARVWAFVAVLSMLAGVAAAEVGFLQIDRCYLVRGRGGSGRDAVGADRVRRGRRRPGRRHSGRLAAAPVRRTASSRLATATD